jgi:hypothetical protein
MVVVSLTLLTQVRWKAAIATSMMALPAIILSIGVSGLVHDEMPLFRVNNILVRNPDLRADLGDSVASKTWRRILCSHDTANKLTTCAASERDPAQLEAQYFGTASSFLELVVLLISFRVIVLRTARHVHLHHFWFPVARTLIVLTTIVVAVFGLMLPYVHAKLIALTEFSEVAVTLAEAGSTIKPPLAGPTYELHHSDSAVTLYEMLSDKQHVITETALSNVVLLRYMGFKDVLALHIQQSASPKG